LVVKNGSKARFIVSSVMPILSRGPASARSLNARQSAEPLR
jgi:hypothetical protein